MQFKRMPLEKWFDDYQYKVKYNLGESGVKWTSLDQLNIEFQHLPLRYGYHQGNPELREVIAAQYKNIKPDQVLITNGASEALFVLASVILNPGDHVIIEHPNYPSNYEVPRSLGCNVDFLELKFDQDFKPEINELRELIKPKTKLISLTHPNNPTGSIISKELLLEIIELAERYNCYLILDETYRDLSWDYELPLAATLSSKVISISSMSKSLGLPGIRIGWLISTDKSIIEAALAVREQITICNSALGEMIALFVLRNQEKYLETLKKHITQNLEKVSSWIEQEKDYLEWIKPEAGVVCFPRIKMYHHLDPEKLYRSLVEDFKTFVIPGRCFEIDNCYFRLGYGGETEELETGLKNIDRALQENL